MSIAQGCKCIYIISFLLEMENLLDERFFMLEVGYSGDKQRN